MSSTKLLRFRRSIKNDFLESIKWIFWVLIFNIPPSSSSKPSSYGTTLNCQNLPNKWLSDCHLMLKYVNNLLPQSFKHFFSFVRYSFLRFGFFTNIGVKLFYHTRQIFIEMLCPPIFSLIPVTIISSESKFKHSYKSYTLNKWNHLVWISDFCTSDWFLFWHSALSCFIGTGIIFRPILLYKSCSYVWWPWNIRWIVQ